MFCTSCGHRLDLSKERCEGCSVLVPRALKEHAASSSPASKVKDRWQTKYCSPPSTTSSRHATPTSSKTTLRASTSTPTAPPPTSSSSFSRTNTDPTLPTLSSSSSITPSSSASSLDYAPLLPNSTGSSTGSLQKVFGSVLEQTPQNARCLKCSDFFGRLGSKATIYPAEGHDPASPDARFLCQKCYTGQNSKGDCQLCKKAVLGLVGDPMIESRGSVWHERCYLCIDCGGEALYQNLSGKPSCEPCFLGSAGVSGPTTITYLTTYESSGGLNAPARKGLSTARSRSPSTVTHRVSIQRPASPLPKTEAAAPSSQQQKIKPKSSFTPSTPTASPLKGQGPSVADLTSRFQFAPSSPADSARLFLSSSMSSPRAGVACDRSRPSSLATSTSGWSSTRPSPSPSPSGTPVKTSFTPRPQSKTPMPPPSFYTSPIKKHQLPSSKSVPVEVAKPRNIEPDLRLEDLMGGNDEPSPPTPSRLPRSNALANLRDHPFLARSTTEPLFPSTRTPVSSPARPQGHDAFKRPELKVATSFPSTSSPSSVAASKIFATGRALPRLGGLVECPGCATVVGPSDRDAVSGPGGGGVKWHKACLCCGGGNGKGKVSKGKARAMSKGVLVGCGKALDAGAKYDQEGGVWCRDCLCEQRASQSKSQPVIVNVTGTYMPAPSPSSVAASRISTLGESRQIPSRLSSSMYGSSPSRPVLPAATQSSLEFGTRSQTAIAPELSRSPSTPTAVSSSRGLSASVSSASKFAQARAMFSQPSSTSTGSAPSSPRPAGFRANTNLLSQSYRGPASPSFTPTTFSSHPSPAPRPAFARSTLSSSSTRPLHAHTQSLSHIDLPVRPPSRATSIRSPSWTGSSSLLHSQPTGSSGASSSRRGGHARKDSWRFSGARMRLNLEESQSPAQLQESAATAGSERIKVAGWADASWAAGASGGAAAAAPAGQENFSPAVPSPTGSTLVRRAAVKQGSGLLDDAGVRGIARRVR